MSFKLIFWLVGICLVENIFCSESEEYNFDCGTNNNPERISISSDVGLWPWMASLGFHSSDDKWNHKCGASLISKNFLITAAHCAKPTQDSLNKWQVRLGDTILDNPSDDDSVEEREIEEIFVHPKYVKGRAYFDVALLKVADLEFGIYIRPVCLPSTFSLDLNKYEGKTATVTGWGQSSKKSDTSPKLQKAILTIYDYNYCNKTHEEAEGPTRRTIHDYLPQLFQPHLLCAGYEASDQGSCNGDSGGPIVTFNTKSRQYFLTGSVIGGVSTNCGDRDYPGIYSRIDNPEILDFIMTNAFQTPLDLNGSLEHESDLFAQNDQPISTMKSKARTYNCTTESYTKSDGSVVCAFFLDGIMTWNKGAKECKRNGARLPEINSIEDNEQILELKPERFWIWLGITRSEAGYFSVWDDSKSRISYSNWAKGEPDNRLGSEDCVSMLRNTGEWDDLPCDYEPVKTLCEKIIQPPLIPDFECTQSYTRSDGSRACGFFVKGSLTWHEAAEKCALYQSRLPEIQSQHDNINIMGFKPEKFPIWLGLTRSNSSTPFKNWSSSNSSLVFTNWARNEPDNRLGNEECVSIVSNTGVWDDLPCGYKPVKTLCEHILEAPRSPDPDCTVWYSKSNGSDACGFFLEENFSWEEAAAQCDRRGARLPEIESDLDNNNILKIKPEEEWIWLGLFRIEDNSTEFSWKSSGSNLSFVNWASGEPDNRLGNEDCVSMLRNTGEWDDIPCDYEPVKTFCEKIILNE